MKKLYALTNWNTMLFKFTVAQLFISCIMTGVALTLFSSRASAQMQVVRFDTAGVGQTFTVPANVTTIEVKAWGAGGGAYCCGTPYPNVGGGGGFTTAIIAVTPGETLTVNIGGGGNTAGGVNGGGAGTYGAGGGGSTDLARGSAYLVIAGGGGGAGNGTGGSGGGLQGTAATVCDVASQGGSQISGGLLEDCGQGSSNGSYHQGGWGMEGGGGGGYYGGGGGSCGCGGGGGSGYVTGTCTSLVTAPSGSYGFVGGVPPDTVDLDYNGTAGRGHISTGTIVSGNGSPGLLVIKYNYPTVDTPSLVGYDTVCPGIATTYVTDALMNNYVWTVTGGGAIASGGTSTDPTVSIIWSSPGTVSVKYTDDCTGTNSATTSLSIVTYRPSLTITANPAGPICQGTAVTFTATPTDAGNDPSYQWLQDGSHVGTDSGQTFTTSVLSNNDVITALVVSIVSGQYCTSAASNALTMNISGTGGNGGTITASPDTVCSDNTSRLSAAGNPVNSQWQSLNGNIFSNINGANNSIYTTPPLSQTTGYRFIGQYGTCTDTSATLTVTVAPTPATPLLSTNDSTICSGDSAMIQATAGYARYVWNNSDTLSYTYIKTGGNYRVTVTNASGCTAVSKQQSITVFPTTTAPSVSTPDSLICSSDSTEIQTSPTSYSSYLWSDGDTRSYTFVNSAGNYRVTVTDANGCTAVSNNQNISVYPVPSVSIDVNGDTLSAFNSHSYQWILNDTAIQGATSSVYVAQQSGDYSVQVVDTNGCPTISSKTHVTVTGVEDLGSTGGLTIFPDPVTNVLFVKSNSADIHMQGIEIYDITGRLVFSKKNNEGSFSLLTIDVSWIASGPYYVKGLTNKTNYIYSMMKQ